VGRATLAIPIAGPPPRWAARELVVLHELGHHVAPPDDDHPAHGPHFTGAVVALVAGALGAEAALLLRAAYDGAGVAVAEGP
jgi:putative metallohydrolase (TIGR04338 family)